MAKLDAYATGEGDLDLRSLGFALLRRKYWIIVPTILAAIAATVVVNLITPRYKSEARIVYDGRENVFLRPDAERSMTSDAGRADPETLTDQVQIVLSRQLALGLIAELKLNEMPEFDPVLRGPSTFRHILAITGLTRDYLAMSAEERMLESWYDRLTAYALEKSRVIVIEFQSINPALAARITNAIAADYLRREQLFRQEQTRGAGQWLAGEIETLRRKVADAEAKAEAFRSDTNLLVGTNNTTLSNQQLGEFSTQLATARGQKADAETRARIIREMLRRGEAIESSDIVNSELIRRLSEQRVTLRAQLAEQSSTLLDGHPRIKELKAQIADLDRQIRAEADKLARTFDNDARIAAARVDAMGVNLDSLKKQAASANEQDLQYRALEREAKAQRDLLENYLAKYRETTARESIGNAPADAKIISSAFVSNTPAYPRRLPTVAVATLLTLVLSGGLVTTSELMRATAPQRDNTPRRVPVERNSATVEHAEKPLVFPTERAEATVVESPTIAGHVESAADESVEAAKGEAPLPPASPPVKSAAHPLLGVPLEAIRDVAARLGENADLGCGVAVFAASATIPSTLPALTLARRLAADAKVAIVGLVPGVPALDAVAASPSQPGVADMVNGTASFGEIIGKDWLSGVHIIRFGDADLSRDALISSQQFTVMIQALSRVYAQVIIDAGPISSDCERLAAVAPRAVLITAGSTPEEITAAAEMLTGAGFADIAMMSGTVAGAALSRGLVAA